MLWKIEQMKEGVKVTFDASMMFGSGSARLSVHAKESIRDLVRMLTWCRDRVILVDARSGPTAGAETHHNLWRERMAAVTDLASELGLKGVTSVQPVEGTTTERLDNQTARSGSQVQRG